MNNKGAYTVGMSINMYVDVRKINDKLLNMYTNSRDPLVQTLRGIKK